MSYQRVKNRFKDLCKEIEVFAKKKTGGIALFLFIIQFITGMVLSFYYIPYFEQAHKSILDIVTKLNMGCFFRSIHHWGAQLIMAALFIHTFSILLLKSYRRPKHLLWLSGFILLGISIFFGLSGYLLVWDERAFAAVKVATGGAGSIPIAGVFIKSFLRGGIDVTGETLTRFHAFHVSILPIIAILLICIHILLVQYRVTSMPFSLKKRTKQTPFFPYRFYKYLIICLIVLGIVVTLATLFPPEIGKNADPLAPAPENIKPEWYFLFLFQTLKLFPGEILGLNGEMIAVTIISCGIFFLFLIPFFDKRAVQGIRNTVFTWIGIAYTLYFIVMTVMGFLS
ncbi:MAG: cytochrome b N-terminal domain-containing protein [Proteobacteria bacterium]|nr:cytochrome b N-terminal domain-containing protein [Pseudomonadota bacterium]